ncbi:acetyl-CoA carboxylase carboxyltransferase subunit alpha [Solibaculum mannosilyticum]|nr:acetyl-CoA carboxylase carboxyltransferase subunit alpha [Solibaculum mannosilyticum]
MMEQKNLTAWDRVTAARMPGRPTSQYFIDAIFDDFIELHGDRHYGDDASVIGGIALLDGQPVTVIGEEKGQNPADRARRNFGSPHPEGYRKALRLMKQAEKFRRPVICLADTQGAYCGVGAEERGQGEAIARNLKEMMKLTVPVISVVISEGGSGGALAIAVANKVAILQNAIYAILSPEGFAAILWKDASRAKEAAEVMKITADELYELGVVDQIIPEGEEPAETAQAVKRYILRELEAMKAMSPQELSHQRYQRFRAF